MRISDFRRFALHTCVAAALLGGCGGSQPPISPPGAGVQTAAIATHAAHGHSWILPEAKGDDLLLPEAKTGDLLYVAGGCGSTCIVAYPSGELVGSTSGLGTFGACGDGKGNVFIADGAAIDEYAHGGTTPINTFALPGRAYSCGVDPQSGNLAVAYVDLSGNSGVAVFPNAQESPSYYPADFLPVYCGYDNNGNLFITGEGEHGDPAMAEFAKGSQSLSPVSISPSPNGFAGQVQWDGKHLTLEVIGVKKGVVLERLKVSGSTATVIGTTKVKGVTRTAEASWIQGDLIFIPYGVFGEGPYANKIGVWKYPRGGKLVAKFKPSSGRNTNLTGIGYSPASHSSQVFHAAALVTSRHGTNALWPNMPLEYR